MQCSADIWMGDLAMSISGLDKEHTWPATFELNLSDVMTVEIRRITQVSDALEEAFARLMPQLSPRLGAPSREVLRRVAGSETGALLAAVAGERIVGVLMLAWYDAPSGRKAWIEDVVVDGAARGCGAGDG